MYNDTQKGVPDVSEKYQYNKKYAEKYLRDKFDEIRIRVPKGRKEEYKELAEKAGKSLNQFIIDQIEKGQD
jgi:predicted HicB family RNase H-like nuclease